MLDITVLGSSRLNMHNSPAAPRRGQSAAPGGIGKMAIMFLMPSDIERGQ
jgi:hypothetical protein